jgi:tRNA-dihydrouridine synthase C
MPWSEVNQLLLDYSGYEIFGDKGKYFPNRLKQWLGYLSRQYPEAESLFMQVRRLSDSHEIVRVLQQRH